MVQLLLLMVSFVLVVLIHEGGHMVGLSIQGISSSLHIELMPPRIYVRASTAAHDWRGFWALLAGPSANLLIALITAAALGIYGIPLSHQGTNTALDMTRIFMWMNLIVALLSILPAKEGLSDSDGRQMLACLEDIFPARKRLIARLGNLASWLLIALAILVTAALLIN